MRPEKTRLRGYLRDKRFHPILQQSLGRVAETLARRLLASEGFEVKDFSRYVSPYVAGIRHFAETEPARKQLWDQMLHLQGPLFGDPRVREFVDDLVQFRVARKQARGIGASIDLIANREGTLHLIEVKSADARLEPHQMKALEIARLHGIETGVVRVRFVVNFDHAELYRVRTNQDARIVSNFPDETLDS